MISERELVEAINECENAPKSLRNCEKLATYYTLLDKLYPVEKDYERAMQAERRGYFDPLSISDSEFMQVISDIDWECLLKILDELMDTIQVVQPKLYDAVMRKLRE